MSKQDMKYIHDMLARLDDRLDDMDSKIDERLSHMDQKLHSLDKTADLQRVSIEHHIKRTDLLEKALTERSSEIQKIQKHVTTVQTIFTFVCKFVGAIAVLVGIWAAFRG